MFASGTRPPRGVKESRTDTPECVAFVPGSKRVVVGNRRGTAVVVDPTVPAVVATFVPPQRPSARHDDGVAISLGMNEFTLPTAGPEQLRCNFVQRCRKDSLQQFMSDSADCIVPAPAVELLSARIPVSYDIIHVTDENSVVSQIKEVRLVT